MLTPLIYTEWEELELGWKKEVTGEGESLKSVSCPWSLPVSICSSNAMK
jgi:hypothetical protein